jgi:ATP-dependent DNA ligase
MSETGNGQVEPRCYAVVKALTGLPDDTMIDGEVALDERDRPSSTLLQGLGTGAPLIVLYAFNLLMLRGRDVRGWSLEERRDELREVIKKPAGHDSLFGNV